MKEKVQKTLPIHFYDSKGWCKSLVSYYTKNDKLPANVLEYPLEALTASFANIINVYGNYPDSVVVLISQTVNPLFSPEEYENKIYRVIKEKAKERKDPYIDAVAESLYYIRLLFEQNKDYISENFKNEIKGVSDCPEDERLNKFAEELSKIVKVHARQVSELIKEQCS